MKNLKSNLAVVCSFILLASCSFVKLNPQATNTQVVSDVGALSDCKYLGDTNASIWSKAGTFQSDKSVESQLDTLARNDAATMNGNTVVPKSDIVEGKRTYGVYECSISK